MDNVKQLVESVLPTVVELRHELHQHPELCYQEQWTSQRIQRFLTDHGVEFQSGLAGGTGIVATIGRGEKVIALRADMDALAICENSGVPYASKTEGMMHACGHDGHTACLCGTAAMLKAMEDQLNVTVKLIFQPAEESGAGALKMVQDGALNGVDAIFGLHGWPALETGKVAVRSGPTMAIACPFQLTIGGESCHGSQPHLGIDPILAASHIVVALQSIVSREMNPLEPVVVSIGRIQAGLANNIIPQTAVMEGTLRTYSESVKETALKSIQRIASNTAKAFRASATLSVDDSLVYPPVSNPLKQTDFVKETVLETLGESALAMMEEPSMGAEDFSYYLKEIPGCYFFLGIKRKDGSTAPLHNERFDFDDEALSVGISVFTGLVSRFGRH